MVALRLVCTASVPPLSWFNNKNKNKFAVFMLGKKKKNLNPRKRGDIFYVAHCLSVGTGDFVFFLSVDSRSPAPSAAAA